MRFMKETVIGAIPSHWELKTIDEIKSPEKKSIISGPFGSNISAKYFVSNGIPVVRGNNLSLDLSVKFKDEGFVFVSEEKAAELATWATKDDIILTAVGTIGQVGILEGCEKYTKYIISNKQLRLRINKSLIEPLYTYYWLGSPQMIETIKQRNTGSSVPLINLSVLKSLFIPLPPRKEQVQIISILQSLDDKIDLLHRQNKTLEAMAETLFRHWFVEEADESWEVAKLGDLAAVQNGYAFSSRDYVPFEDNNLEVLKMGHIAVGGGLRTNPKKDFVPRVDKLKRWILNKNDIVMGMTDMKDNVVILGVPAMIDKSNKYVLNQRVARIYLTSNNKLINSYMLFIQLNNKDFIATLQSKANSGVQVNLSTEVIKDCDIIVPPMEMQIKHGNVIADLFLKKEHNINQIASLTKLRDTLLPKLMSGEVRVQT